MFERAIENLGYSGEKVEMAKSSVVVSMEYYEISNSDFTGIIALVFDKGNLVKSLTNMSLGDLTRDQVWSNQKELFLLPSVEAAVSMFIFQSDYSEITTQELEEWYN